MASLDEPPFTVEYLSNFLSGATSVNIGSGGPPTNGGAGGAAAGGGAGKGNR